VQRLMNNNKLN